MLATIDFNLTSDDWLEALGILAKLGVGALLGGIIGFERERTGRPAGIRTHMLLVMGVVLICESSKAFGGQDASRIAAQIVTGVGFLGAGTIMRTGLEVKGLTTAASLWAASAIGFAVSIGGAFLIVAAVATLLTLFTLAVVDNVERRLVPHAHPRDLLVKLESREALRKLLATLDQADFRVEQVRYVGAGPDCQVQLGIFGDPEAIFGKVSTEEGVLACEWQG